MADIFVSYSHEDETRIRDLVPALEEQGWSIFWDRRIPTGQTWQEYIGQGLSDAKCVIVAWSHHSITSEWVIEEANDAKERGLLMPILLDPVNPPLGFRGIQAADLTDWKRGSSSPRFDQLIQDIAGIVGGKPRQPASKEELTSRTQPVTAPSRPQPSEAQPEQPQPWKKRNYFLIGGVAALVLALVVGLGLWSRREPKTDIPSKASSSAGATQRRGVLDYTNQMPPVRDQGQEGSVVGFAVAAALEYQIEKTHKKRIIISPRYIYYYARLDAGKPTDTDSGALVQNAVDVLRTRGAVPEEDWPYKSGQFAVKPPKNIEMADHYKISQAQPVHDVEELKAALQKFGPVIGSFSVYQAFTSDIARKSGYVPMPNPNEAPIGGTAVCFVGFDDAKQLLKFQYSWGKQWGDQGYGYITYEYAEKFLKDSWAIAM